MSSEKKSGGHRPIHGNVIARNYGVAYAYAATELIGTSEPIESISLNFVTEKSLTDVSDFLSSLGFNKLHVATDLDLTVKPDEEDDPPDFRYFDRSEGSNRLRMFKAPNSFCFINIYNSPKTKHCPKKTLQFAVDLVASGPSAILDQEAIVAFAKESQQKRIAVGEIHTIASSNDGFYFRKMGHEGEEYIASNYSEEHTLARNYILDQLSSPNPNGRLSILFGPPGTGKTHFIKSLLGHVPSSIFVYIPPHLVPDISNPGFVSAIMDQRASHPDKKIILVIEDADQVLSTRMADNMSDINGLLNLTDGFLASSFDIRIIATTNSKVQDLDAAIMRPGRLCVKMNFGLLTQEQAAKCFDGLTSGGRLCDISNKPEYTLAEVYELAAQTHAPAVSVLGNKKKSFGF